ncbi:MAG: hypothetical protein WAK31_24495 [Chthoniobacterales bacterium]
MSDSNPPTIDPELLIHILIETESGGRMGIPSAFSRDIMTAHKILLRDADFAEVKLAMGSTGGFLYPAEAVLLTLKRRGRDFLRLSQNRDIWKRFSVVTSS